MRTAPKPSPLGSAVTVTFRVFAATVGRWITANNGSSVAGESRGVIVVAALADTPTGAELREALTRMGLQIQVDKHPKKRQ